jgi:hypothetical protein
MCSKMHISAANSFLNAELNIVRLSICSQTEFLKVLGYLGQTSCDLFQLS